MCSLISPAFAEYRDALAAAVAEVAENSLFAFVDASDEATFDAAAAAPLAAGGSDWLRACVHFKGSIAGRFDLTVPEPLARHLCASFAGAEVTEAIGDSELLDFTGEFANMVCGTWLTRARKQEAFNLTPPQVLRGPPNSTGPGDAGSERFYLSVDDAPIRLEVNWLMKDPSTSTAAAGRERERV
jgi:CheY-specific phosphatase CheX